MITAQVTADKYLEGQVQKQCTITLFKKKWKHGAAYSLYDPQVATIELQSLVGQELHFCAGKLLKVDFED